MSAEKCGESLTIGMLEEAMERARNTCGSVPDRIVSQKAYKMLERIRQKDPGWDRWTFETEIWFKAYSMGLINDE